MSTIIKCPYCGYEYLPGEILYPDQVVGQPTTVIRDPLNKIIYNEWKPEAAPIAEDTYVCDNCSRAFVTTIDVSYKVKKKEETLDFSELTSSLI